MNVPANKVEKPMLLEFMADKYGLKPVEFAETVRKTCGLPNATPEEFAAFIMVARQYDLNPILREIHAFPRKGGGIVPVVSIDGWVNLINRQPQCDGFDFDVDHDGPNGQLVSMTCSMYRKDRSHPTVVTEYLSECIRATEPWKMQHRMLRHKTLIQAGRYAFGFSGIYDEDEAERIAAAVDITPPEPPKPQVRVKPPARSLPRITSPDVAQTLPPTPPVKEPKPVATARYEPQTTGATAFTPPAEDTAKIYDPETGEVNDAAEPTPTELLASLEDMLATAQSEEEAEEIWDGHDVEARLEGVEKGDRFLTLAMGIKQKHLTRIAG